MLLFLLPPDGLNLQQLVLEHLDGLASLIVVVLEDVSAAAGAPIADAAWREVRIAWVGRKIRRT